MVGRVFSLYSHAKSEMLSNRQTDTVTCTSTGTLAACAYRGLTTYLVSFQDCHSVVPRQHTHEILHLQMEKPHFQDSKNPTMS